MELITGHLQIRYAIDVTLDLQNILFMSPWQEIKKFHFSFYVTRFCSFHKPLLIPYLHELHNDDSRGNELAWLKKQKIWNSLPFHFRFGLGGLWFWWIHFTPFIFLFWTHSAAVSTMDCMDLLPFFWCWMHEHFITDAYSAWFSALIYSYHGFKIISVTTALLCIFPPGVLSGLPKLI